MSRARILIVEDDLNLLEGIRTVLELEDYEVLSSENGEHALEILSQNINNPPDLIVSDIMMPRIDGMQLLNQVRKRAEWVGIPFIFLTARSEKSDVIQGKRLGVDDYLVKPFDADDLLLAIESRLNRHKILKKAQNDEITDLKRKILTILNHEFRTPLTFLVAYTDMLNEQNADLDDESDTAIFLRGINVGAVRLRRLIENFIYLVEMETGDAKRIFEMRKTVLSNYNDLLNAARTQWLENTPNRQCHIVVGDDLPPIVTDPVYLNVAILQLLDNAAKFSEEDKPITLSAALVDGKIEISVADQGRGISPSEQERIWEPFYQIDRAIYEDQGAGSGLAIVRGIVMLHNGEVHVESKHNVGSNFKILLPLASVEDFELYQKAIE